MELVRSSDEISRYEKLISKGFVLGDAIMVIAVEKENRIRKLKEIEALRDELVKQMKKYKRD